MSASTRKHWLLKVIAGPHQGAEMRLTAGQALVGKDDDCDVVLHDVLVAPQHFALELGDGGITVAPLGGRVYCAGKRIKEAREKVPPFSFITLGGTHLVIGPAEEKWPLLSPADIPQLEPDGPEVVTDGSDVKSEVVMTTPAPAALAPIQPVPPVQDHSSRKALLGISAGVLILAAWAVVFFIYFYDHKKPRPLTEAEQAALIVKSAGFEGRVKIDDQGGHILASGYVDTDVQKSQLQSSLRDQVPNIISKIWSLDKLVAIGRMRLNEQHLPLEVSALPDGRLKISGKVSLAQSDAWQRAKQALSIDIPAGLVEDLQEARPSTPSKGSNQGRLIVVNNRNLAAAGANSNGLLSDRGPNSPNVRGQASGSGSVSAYEPGSGSQYPSGTASGSGSGSGYQSPSGMASGSGSGSGSAGFNGGGSPSAMGSGSGAGAASTIDPVTGAPIVATDANGNPIASPGSSENDQNPRVSYIKSRRDGLNWVRAANGELYFKGAKLPNGSIIQEITPEKVRIISAEGLREVPSGGLLWESKSATSQADDNPGQKGSSVGLTVSHP